MPSIPRRPVLADPNCAGSAYTVRLRTTKFGVVTDMGMGVLGGQPCHSICTNASRGLSPTAEFLVQ